MKSLSNPDDLIVEEITSSVEMSLWHGRRTTKGARINTQDQRLACSTGAFITFKPPLFVLSNTSIEI